MHIKYATFLTLVLLLTSANGKAQDSVYVINVKGTIDNGLAAYVERTVENAEQNRATGILLDIDTFGGLVDAADNIRKILLESSIPVVAYIDKNAASAGALISLAADSIFMAPGSSIGAATVVEGQTGKKASEKMQSYMRGLMRSTAQANGRNPRIAEAMVDESIAIEGVISEGKLLTFSNIEAVNNGIADATLPSVDAVRERMNWSAGSLINLEQQWYESFLRFIANPVVSSILMLMMLSGLYFEFQTPGFGFGGAAAAVGAIMFFAPMYIIGFAQSWEIVLFFIGILLIVVEIFIIPGFGIPGILGALLLVFSLGASLIGNVGLDFPSADAISQAIWTLCITLVLGIATMVSISKYLPDNRYVSKLILQNTTDRTGGYVSKSSNESLTGATGTTITPLRPSGIAKINNSRVDVVSQGGYIESDTPVVVVNTDNSRTIVAPIEKKDT